MRKRGSFLASLTILFALGPMQAEAAPGWWKSCMAMLGTKTLEAVKPVIAAVIPMDPFEKLVTKDLGFEADFQATRAVEKALANYLRAHPEKHAEGVDIQVLRDLENIEDRIGWSRLWTANFQAALNRKGSFEYFSTSSFDGLLYLPHEDGVSAYVWGDTHEFHKAEDLISKANGGKQVVLSELKIIREKRTEGVSAYSLQFLARVRPADGQPLKEGERILSATTEALSSPSGFLVGPLKIDRDEIGLAKENGEYVVRMTRGYRWETRMRLERTPNMNDISEVFSVAARDTGVKLNHRFGSGYRLEAGTSEELAARFERELIRRFSELQDFVAARKSRASWLADGVSEETAAPTRRSGFASLEEAYASMGISQLDGSSTTSTRAAWHAHHPTLYLKGELVHISVDDRIYGSYYPGFDAIHKAKANPMTPVKTEKGGYVVNYRLTRALLWSGYYESYALFATKEKAEAFIRAHRFVVDPKQML